MCRGGVFTIGSVLRLVGLFLARCFPLNFERFTQGEGEGKFTTCDGTGILKEITNLRLIHINPRCTFIHSLLWTCQNVYLGEGEGKFTTWDSVLPDSWAIKYLYCLKHWQLYLKRSNKFKVDSCKPQVYFHTFSVYGLVNLFTQGRGRGNSLPGIQFYRNHGAMKYLYCLKVHWQRYLKRSNTFKVDSCKPLVNFHTFSVMDLLKCLLRGGAGEIHYLRFNFTGIMGR